MKPDLNAMSNAELVELLGKCVRRDKAEIARLKRMLREACDELQARDEAEALAKVRMGELP